VIEFHLDGRSGVAPYLQLIHQVRHALRLGMLREGDQLPKVKDVAAGLAINPNTVLKAYRELEYEGLAAARAGDRDVRDRGRWATARRWPRTGRCAATCGGGWPRPAAPGWTRNPSRPCSSVPFGPPARRT